MASFIKSKVQLEEDPTRGIVFVIDPVSPANAGAVGAQGYAPGCIWINLTGSFAMYRNTGTITSASWASISTV